MVINIRIIATTPGIMKLRLLRSSLYHTRISGVTRAGRTVCGICFMISRAMEREYVLRICVA
jgi:hypothetical protein